MQNQKSYRLHFIVLSIALIAMFLVNISLGQSKIPLSEILSSLMGNGSSKHIWEFIVIEHRLPKAITAIIAGGGLSVAGLIMQTMFRNPLAEDRKSTRLNSSHVAISYAVFCLKKKNTSISE